ncbi:hypothetical protein FA95DRAFT_1613860 [Auriscalpium vulgare]|uniref:Uncharacterized protein n=1 Tax=Auriscalpium vulgare TaxID=40419 RepID=A0ACB8R1B9_9AGAM|nr:hypothetical protein FA95DRAFT_1613860 [Auriscalpium vulgare]
MSGRTSERRDRIDVFLVKPSKVMISYAVPPSSDPTKVDVVFEAADQRTGVGIQRMGVGIRSGAAHTQDNGQRAGRSDAAQGGRAMGVTPARRRSNESGSKMTTETSDSQAGSVLCAETPPRPRLPTQGLRWPVHDAAPPLPPRSPQEWLTEPNSSARELEGAESMFPFDDSYQDVHLPMPLPGGVGSILTARIEGGQRSRTTGQRETRGTDEDIEVESNEGGHASPVSSHTEPSTPMQIHHLPTSPPLRRSRSRPTSKARGSSPLVVEAAVDEGSQFMAQETAGRADGGSRVDADGTTKRGRGGEEEEGHERKWCALGNGKKALPSLT